MISRGRSVRNSGETVALVSPTNQMTPNRMGIPIKMIINKAMIFLAAVICSLLFS
jgi:hypothetical protein